MKAIDKTKKSNIKCEHCGHFSSDRTMCLLNGQRKYYWNKCSEFSWDTGSDRENKAPK